MTIQRRIVMGLGDIKAITLECVTCSSRLCLPPDSEIEVPKSCPQCHKEWRSLNPPNRTFVGSPFVEFANAIRRIRSLVNEGVEPGFKALIEFDEI